MGPNEVLRIWETALNLMASNPVIQSCICSSFRMRKGLPNSSKPGSQSTLPVRPWWYSFILKLLNIYSKQITNKFRKNLWFNTRRIYRGAVNLILFRHCPSKIFWKCIIWNINIQYKNGWYTLQKLTKPVFALWKNFRIFFTVRSGKLSKVALFWGKIVNLHFFWVDIGKICKFRCKKISLYIVKSIKISTFWG